MDIKTGDDSRWFGRFLFNQRPITFVNIVDAFTVINGLDNWAQNIVNTRNFGTNVVNELGLHFYRRPYNPGFPPGGPDLANQLNFPNWPKRGVDLRGTASSRCDRLPHPRIPSQSRPPFLRDSGNSRKTSVGPRATTT